METKTNTGLVNYAKAQLGKPYWYGCFGNTATASLLTAKKNQYPGFYTASRVAERQKQYGQRVHDCVGLIKGFLWSDNPTATPKYNSAQDVSANGMLAKCKEQGKISTLPEIPGILVFMDGHVGVYIGDGKVIECTVAKIGGKTGVITTTLAQRKWTSWGKCPYITYETKSNGSAKSGKTTNYYKQYTGKSASLVDALKAIKVDSSFSNRKKIAEVNGINNYKGTAPQNVKLLSLLKKGTLIKP